MNISMVSQTNMLQVKSLGACLSSDAQEWYVRNVKHHGWAIREWTLESALKGLQEKFLHSLMHGHAATKFDATQQPTGQWHCSGLAEQVREIHIKDGQSTRPVYNVQEVFSGPTGFAKERSPHMGSVATARLGSTRLDLG